MQPVIDEINTSFLLRSALSPLPSDLYFLKKSTGSEDISGSLNRQIEMSFQLARVKLENTINYLNTLSQSGKLYPSYTENESIANKPSIPNGAWITENAKFWSAGAFPALLWKMHQIETDSAMKKFWETYAKAWSEPLRAIGEDSSTGDMAINNLFVFKPWFENSSGLEKKQQLNTIFRGTQSLAKPYQFGQGRFHTDIGAMGYERIASRTDNQKHWHIFIDHTINVEQLLWAAAHNPNTTEAEDWKNKAVQHIKTIGKTFDSHRRPGNSGTWQRGYFDQNITSSTYGQFLFNEGKQGWKDGTTWSRGQAWVIYGASVTYQYTKDSEVLAIAKNAINYFLDYLPDRFPGGQRRAGDFIPPWDFDYGLTVNPDTQRDSSAATIAISGILKLISTLPNSDLDKQRYFKAVENILFELTSSTYLASKKAPEMSILRHGCYHHFEAIQPTSVYDNGLIWGDYFFIDALIEYRNYQRSLLS